MDRIPALVVALTAVAGAVILGGVFSEAITAHVRRYLPDFSYEGETFLLWGLFVITLFAMSLLAAYLFMNP